MDFKVTMRKGLFIGKFVIALILLSIAYQTFNKYGRTVMHREDDSMEPTIRRGQWVWLDKTDRKASGMKINQIIAYKHPERPREYYVGRIKGLPGDTVHHRQRNKDIFLPRGHVWVRLDNPKNDPDSRHFGPLHEHFILGKANWTQVLPRDERKISE